MLPARDTDALCSQTPPNAHAARETLTMFRWCAYCQGFIGEAGPLHIYAVTHGVCGTCVGTVLNGTYRTTPTGLIAQKLLHATTASSTCGDFTFPEALFQEAIDAKMRPSDLFLGVLQPALYRLGLQWGRGEVTPAMERVFSDWCGRVVSRFADEPVDDGPPTILLTPLFENVHDLGITFLATFLKDNHVPCRLIVPGLPDDELVDTCVQLRPAFCGLSVSLPTSVSHAVSLANRIQSETDGETTAILGGVALREARPVDSGIAVFQNMPALLGMLRAT